MKWKPSEAGGHEFRGKPLITVHMWFSKSRKLLVFSCSFIHCCMKERQQRRGEQRPTTADIYSRERPPVSPGTQTHDLPPGSIRTERQILPQCPYRDLIILFIWKQGLQRFLHSGWDCRRLSTKRLFFSWSAESTNYLKSCDRTVFTFVSP